MIKILKRIKSNVFIKIYEKFINERTTYEMVYLYKGLKYDLKFVSNGYQAQKIIRGFVKTIRGF